MNEEHQERHTYRRAMDSNIVKILLMVISFMSGVIMTGTVSWMTYVRSAVTLSEVNEQIDLKEKSIQTEIDTLIKGEDLNRQSITWMIENPDRSTTRKQ